MRGRDREPQPGTTRMVVVGALGAMLIAQLSHLVAGQAGLFSEGLFADADVYMWFNRVEALAEGRGWFDHYEPRVFPPEGHVQHWTRPLDGLLWAGGAVLGQLFGFRDGLALWGNLISPLLLVVTGVLMFRLGRLLLPRLESAVAAGMFVLYPAVLGMFSWGRADHHSLLGVGQVAFTLGLLSFFLSDERRNRRAFFTGVVGAVAIWVNVEALAYVLIGMVVLGLWWLVGRRDLTEANVAMSGGVFGGTIGAVIVERGPAFFDYYPIDTIGISYVVLFGLTWLFWIGLWAWSSRFGDRGGLVGRGVVAAVLAAGVLGVLAAVVPSFFAGPFAHVDELYRQVRLEYLAEQMPVIMPALQGPLEMAGRALVFFGIAILGVVAVVVYVDDEASSRVRWAWAMLAATGLVFAAVSMDAVRWTMYIPAGAAPCFALAAGRFLRWVDRIRTAEGAGPIKTSLIRPVAIVAVLVGIPAIGAGLEHVSEKLEEDGESADRQRGAGVAESPRETGVDCDLRVAADAVAEDDEIDGDRLVAINPDRSSEWMYRAGHAVTAIANHRPQPGFTLYVEAMSSTDLEQSHADLAEAGVDLAMVCESEIWPVLREDGDATVERLAEGTETGPYQELIGPDRAGGWSIYRVGSY